jgi:hypothetical protein
VETGSSHSRYFNIRRLRSVCRELAEAAACDVEAAVVNVSDVRPTVKRRERR